MSEINPEEVDDCIDDAIFVSLDIRRARYTEDEWFTLSDEDMDKVTKEDILLALSLIIVRLGRIERTLGAEVAE